MLAFVLLAGVGLGAIGLAPSLAVVGVILLGIGALNGWVNVVVIAWVQARTDPEMLGRTMSFLMLGSVVAAPLSLALAAVIVDTNATALFLAAGRPRHRVRRRSPWPAGCSAGWSDPRATMAP